MTVTDRTIDTIGLPSHPKPKQLARYLRAVATRLEADGTQAVGLAALFASRGFPAGTLGDGTGARSATTSTSVERHAGVDGDDGPADPAPHFAEADRRLARTLRLLWKTGLDVEEQITELLAHGDDVDELPAGSGNCQCCERFVRPGQTGSDSDRLRAGLCPACNQAWLRAGRPERGPWIITRRLSLRDAMERGRDPRDLLSS